LNIQSPPTCNVNFLFTDIVSSTKLAQDFPDKLQHSLEKHHKILRESIESNHGFVFEIIGDAFCCAFENADDAVIAAVNAQIKLSEEKWDEAVINVRMGIHSGSAEWNGEKYMGYLTLARTTRIMSAAHGEQIIVSNSTFDLLKKNIRSGISLLDLGEKRLKDLIQPVRLFQVISKGIRENFQPLKTLDDRLNNLPIQLTGFIGREKEIGEIKKLLSTGRILTLVGPGGTGKTRLSMQVAAETMDDFDDGVLLVELAPISDPSLIPFTIARTLKINEEPGQDTEITLVNYLKDKSTLIILDNCEHLIEACAVLTEKLLKKCSNLKIIATSREALKCEGEMMYKVLSLTHPQPEDKNTPLELSQYEAVRLFIERALSVNPSFRVTNENAPALAQICFQLDGIPLAIELAAARTRLMPLDKICEKLEHRFKLLTGGRRTALPRQQTLKALIDWSYDLLTEDEKILFKKLAVFSGGWTFEAAEIICEDGQYDLMDTHSNLQDKSLINSTDVSGTIRFSLLESVRQYAREKYDGNEDIYRKHFLYFKDLSDYGNLNAKNITQIKWIRMIEIDLNNIRSAIDWGADHEPDQASDVVAGLLEFCALKGYFSEGHRICRKMLDLKSSLKETNYAKMLYYIALSSHYLGNIDEAQKLGEEALAIYRKAGEKYGILKSLSVLGVVSALDSSKMEITKNYYNESLALAVELDAKNDIATSLYNISFIEHLEGNLDTAIMHKMQALDLYRQTNDTHNTALLLAHLASHEFNNKNITESRKYIEESLLICNEIDDKFLISINLIVLGNVHSFQKEYEDAFEVYNRALAIVKEGGYKSNHLVALHSIGKTLASLKDYGGAIKNFKESILLGKETHIDYFLSRNLYELAKAYYDLNDHQTALSHFIFLKKITDGHNDPLGKELLETALTFRNKLSEIISIENYQAIELKAKVLGKEEIIDFVLSTKNNG